MKLTYKNIVTLGFIALAVFFITWSFKAYWDIKIREMPTPLPPSHEKLSVLDLFPPPKPEVRAKDWSKVGVYHNSMGHYRVDYPAGNFGIDPDTEKDKVDLKGIEFSENNDNGIRRIDITVSSVTTATSALQALLEVKDGTGKNEYIFEKMITIDGYPAAMGHLGWGDQEVPDIKIVFLLKDHYIFMIYSEYVDHERVWKSFRFE